jgi:hypothetical protein
LAKPDRSKSPLQHPKQSAKLLLQSGAGPLILSWINEICSADTEKRALLVAMGNDLAYVVQAVAPNFVWKTTDFPRATKGYTWSIVLQVLLGRSTTLFFEIFEHG